MFEFGNICQRTLGIPVTNIHYVENASFNVLINEKKQTPCVTPSASLGSEWQNWKLK